MSATRAPFDIIDSLRVSPQSFARQMAWLSASGFQTRSLSELYEARMNRRTLPARSIVLTFDDGYQDFIDYAAPILRTYGFTAHIFLVTGRVGQHSDWDSEKYGIRVPMFDWDAARMLESQGFHCDAHSVTHPPLGSLAAADCRREIHESRKHLADELGRDTEHFAYPFGSYTQETQEILRDEGFRTACSVIGGKSPERDDPYALRRICVHASDRLFDFKCSVMTGVPLRAGLARRARRLRARFRSA